MSGAEDVADEHAGAEDAADAGDDQDDGKVTIRQVYQVNVGKKHVWYPDIQAVSNLVFFKLDKYDRQLTKMCCGTSMNRHKSKGNVVTLGAKRFWRDTNLTRKKARDNFVKTVLKNSMLEAGQQVPPNHKFREARDDDRWFSGQDWIELKLPCIDGFGELNVKAIWQIRGPLFLELKEEVIEYVIESLKQSTELDPASPKRKRKRKKASTPQKERDPHDGLRQMLKAMLQMVVNLLLFQWSQSWL